MRNFVAAAALSFLPVLGLAASSRAALVFTGTQVEHDVQPQYAGNATFASTYQSLTTYGTTDWAYFGATGGTVTKVNQKSGGSGLSNVTTSNFDRNGTVSQGTAANSSFSFTDGTSPTSSSGVNAPGAYYNRGGSINYLGDPGPSFTFSAPVGTGTNSIYLYFSDFGLSQLKIAAYDGSTQVGSDVLVGANGDQYHEAFVYRLDYGGGTTSSGTLNFTLTGNVGGQDDQSVSLEAVGLIAVVPEPASLGLIGVIGGGLLARRRRMA